MTSPYQQPSLGKFLCLILTLIPDLVACITSDTPPMTRPSETEANTISEYVKCVRGKFEFESPEIIHISNVERLRAIDTSAPHTQPFIVDGLEIGFLQNTDKSTSYTLTELMDTLIANGYGEMIVSWQFASTGNASDRELHLFHGNCEKNMKDAYCLSFAKARALMQEKLRDINKKQCLSSPASETNDEIPAAISHPLFISPPSESMSTSTCALEFALMLRETCLTSSSPLYLMTSVPNSVLTARVSRSDSNVLTSSQNRKQKSSRHQRPRRGRQSKSKQKQRRGSRIQDIRMLPRRMILDGFLSLTPPPILIVTRILADSIEKGHGSKEGWARQTQELNGLDVYFGMPMSGTFMHTHGTAVASGSGRKIWILYSPEKACMLSTASGRQILARAKLPPLCDESNPDPFDESSKHHPNASLCLGHLHPLEVFHKMLYIEEQARPMVILTDPGETLVVPERWMHMTVNLGASFTVSYRFERSVPYHLGCPDVPAERECRAPGSPGNTGVDLATIEETVSYD